MNSVATTNSKECDCFCHKTGGEPCSNCEKYWLDYEEMDKDFDRLLAKDKGESI